MSRLELPTSDTISNVPSAGHEGLQFFFLFPRRKTSL
jgi:hypothetical protein